MPSRSASASRPGSFRRTLLGLALDARRLELRLLELVAPIERRRALGIGLMTRGLGGLERGCHLPAPVLEHGDLTGQPVEALPKLVILLERQCSAQLAPPSVERLELLRLLRLPADDAKSALHARDRKSTRLNSSHSSVSRMPSSA